MLLTMLLSMLTFGKAAAAKEAYAVVGLTGNMLTFNYDDLRSLRMGETILLDDYFSGRRPRPEIDFPIMSVTFDNSFAEYRPQTTVDLFAGFDNLEEVVHMENLNTSKVKDMRGMFYDCASLTDVDLSGFDTHNVTSMHGMFYGCKSLKSIDLSELSSTSVTDVGSMFYGCKSLKSVDFSEFSTWSLQTMDRMFEGCESLESVDMSNFVAYKLTDVSSIFNECRALKNVNLTGFEAPYLTNTERMFSSCSALKHLDLSDFTIRRVTSMYEMFMNCSSLESLDLSGFDTQSVTDMSYMFAGCSSLTSLDLSEFNTENVTDMSVMFHACASLKSINLTGFKTGSVTNMNGMFMRCYELMNLDLSSFNTRNVTDMANMFQFCYKLESVDLSSFETDNVTDMSNMFESCQMLTDLDVSHFATANVKSFYSMFAACRGLKSLDVSNFKTHNATNMKRMFFLCSQLSELDLSGFETSKVENMNSMFANDEQLRTIYVGYGWDFSSLQDSESMFSDCKKLVGEYGTRYSKEHTDGLYAHADYGTDWPGYMTLKETPLSYAEYKDGTLTFYYNTDKGKHSGTIYYLNGGAYDPDWYTDHTCMNVTNVVFDPSFKDARPTTTRRWFAEMMSLSSVSGLEYLNMSDVSDMYAMFYNCRQLKTLELVGFNTAKVQDMSYMFYNCSQLTTINVGDGWTTANVTASADMFLNCTRLVGGAGTAYNSSYTDKGRAHADGGTANPGYLSLKSAYVAFNPNNGTLTFYCDGSRSQRTGTTYSLNVSGQPAWNDIAASVKKVVFDPSFAYARPTTTFSWFSGMKQLVDITGMEKLNTSQVTNMSGMFSDCQSLTYLNINGFNLEGVKDMSTMFYNCYSLTQLYLKGERLVNTSTNYMFANCRSLTSLDLSKFDTRGVTNMEGMFSGCSSLTSLDLSRLNTENATVMAFMFSGCSSLTSLNLISYDTHKVENMGRMFSGCSKLATIYVGNGWSTEAVTASGYMFNNCTSLVGGAGTAYDANNVNKAYAHVDGGTADPGYLSLMAYVARDGITMTFCSDDNRNRHEVVYDLDVYSFDTPEWYEDGKLGIKRVVFDPSFAFVRPTTTAKWFHGMENLETVTGMEYLNTSRVEYMDEMFYGCKKLTSLDVSHFDTHNVVDMGSMFENCWSLFSLDLQNFDTHNVKIMSEMFAGCKKLTELNLNQFNTKQVQGWNYMFSGCSALKTIYVGKEWSTESFQSGTGVFDGCTSLVGGAGTTYNANRTSVIYARVDGGTANPGYLTLLAPYVWVDSNTTMMTFYCDDKRSQRTGTTYDLNVGENIPGWSKTAKNMEKVEVDASFANARPTSTALWFYGLNVESITGLEYLNTSKVTDMVLMFSDSEKLKTLDLSSFDTHNVIYTANMFSNCSALTTIIASKKWDMGSVATSDPMFSGCYKLVGGMGTTYDVNHCDKTYARIDGGPDNPGYLTEKKEAYAEYVDGTLTFYYDNSRDQRVGTIYDLNVGERNPGWSDDNNYQNVTHVVFDSSFADARPTTTYSWFDRMTQLQTITGMKEYLNTSEVTSMRSMFAYCEALETLDLSAFDTGNVSNMGEMFNACKSLTSLDVSNFDTRNVTEMHYMFQYCEALETIDLSSFCTDKVWRMERMFSDCTQLTTIYVGSKWSTGKVSSSRAMFSACPNLVGSAGTTFDANHTDAAYAHVDGGSDNPGYLTGKMEAYAELANGTLTFRYDANSGLSTGRVFSLNEDDGSPAWHFDPETGEDTGLVETVTAVVFDKSFTEFLPSTCYGWFSGMENLQSITGMKAYLNTSLVEHMAFMFANCSSLESLDVSGFNTSNVKTMYAMFRNCRALQTLDVTKLKTGRVESMFSMFEGCSGLTSIDVSHFDTRNVTSLESMFENCWSLETLDLSAFDTHNVTSTTRMFIECQALTTITVGDKWTMENVDMENYGSDYMFYDCYKLVGGAGTTYAEWRVDGRYAHIDGGDNDPGYFTAAFLKGDVNNDGQVGIGDIVAITNVMAGIETDAGIVSRADVNGDTQVGIGDIVAVTNIMAGVQ